MTIAKFQEYLNSVIAQAGGNPTGVRIHPKDFSDLLNDIRENSMVIGGIPNNVSLTEFELLGITVKRKPARDGRSLEWEWKSKDP